MLGKDRSGKISIQVVAKSNTDLIACNDSIQNNFTQVRKGQLVTLQTAIWRNSCPEELMDFDLQNPLADVSMSVGKFALHHMPIIWEKVSG